jgi:hypothetical protein
VRVADSEVPELARDGVRFEFDCVKKKAVVPRHWNPKDGSAISDSSPLGKVLEMACKKKILGIF